MADRVMAGTIIAVSLILLVMASGYKPALSYEPIGPRAFPIGILSLIILICLSIFLAARPDPELIGAGGHLWRIVLAALALLTYALLFERLGYLLATFLVTIGIALLAQGRLVPAVLVGAATSVLCYLIFAQALHVNLPLGTWTFG